MGKIILVTGGARSGKSLFAENYAKKYANDLKNNISYIATAEIYDEEMRERILLHKKRRPKEWTTYEFPKNASVAIEEAGEKSDIILFDCLTIYLSNLILSILSMEENIDEKIIEDEINLLINSAKKVSAATIFVTNEVGAGIVPENKLSRIFRDFAGKMNQKFSKNADEVYCVISGCAVDLKKIMVKW